MKYRKRPVVIDARQVTAVAGETVITANGETRAKRGDWIVTDPSNGDTWPVARAYFEQTYELVVRVRDMEAENARLRKALETITEAYAPSNHPEEVARAALEGEDE